MVYLLDSYSFFQSLEQNSKYLVALVFALYQEPSWVDPDEAHCQARHRWIQNEERWLWLAAGGLNAAEARSKRDLAAVEGVLST